MNMDIAEMFDAAVDERDPAVRATVASSDDALDERLKELADMSPLDYERVRRKEAEALGLRVTALDAAVRAARVAAGSEQEKLSQANELLAIGLEGELWRDDADEALATVKVDEHVEHHRVRSSGYRRLLNRTYGDRHTTTGKDGVALPKAPGQQAVTEALNAIEAQAQRGPVHATPLRVGGHDGKVYLDLGCPSWRAVEIDAAGWRVVDRCPVRFLRTPGMQPLPEPVRGDGLAKLKRLLRLDDTTSYLAIGWLLGCFRPHGPYPVLAVHGEQGTGKTTLMRVLRRLIDPNKAGDRAPPRNEHELIIAATNSYLIAFDNFSHISDPLSDTMCRIATGGGFSARALYTDGEEKLFQVCRPQMLNGIPDLARAGDLIDRAIMLELQRRPPGSEAFEEDFWATFEADTPMILGALLDAVSTALRRQKEVKLRGDERLLDFARWVEAAAPALGWAEGDFLDAHQANRLAAARGAIEADVVATVLLREFEHDSFSGTAEGLLNRLNAVTEDERRAPSWPKTARSLANALRRAAPALQRAGVTVEMGERTSKARIIRIRGGENSSSSSSQPSPTHDDDDAGDDAMSTSSNQDERGYAGSAASRPGSRTRF